MRVVDRSQLIFLALKTQPLLDFLVKEIPGVMLADTSQLIFFALKTQPLLDFMVKEIPGQV